MDTNREYAATRDDRSDDITGRLAVHQPAEAGETTEQEQKVQRQVDLVAARDAE